MSRSRERVLTTSCWSRVQTILKMESAQSGCCTLTVKLMACQPWNRSWDRSCCHHQVQCTIMLDVCIFLWLYFYIPTHLHIPTWFIFPLIYYWVSMLKQWRVITRKELFTSIFGTYSVMNASSSIHLCTVKGQDGRVVCKHKSLVERWEKIKCIKWKKNK